MGGRTKHTDYHKDIKRRRTRKELQHRIHRLQKAGPHFRTGAQTEEKDKLIVSQKVSNSLQNAGLRLGLGANFLLLGMMFIDNEAVCGRSQEHSILRSMFKFYSVHAVSITPDYLILKLHPNHVNIYPLSYWSARLRSAGDRDLLDIAEMLENASSMLVARTSASSRGRQPTSEKEIQRVLSAQAGKQNILMLAPDVMAFSRQLLALGGYSLQQAAENCLAHRAFLLDFFLAENYVRELQTYLSKQNLSTQLRAKLITPAEYVQASTCTFYSSIIGSSENKILVKSRRYNLEPGLMCWEVDNIIHEEKLVGYKKPWLTKISECKQQNIAESYKDVQAINFPIGSLICSPQKLAIQKEKVKQKEKAVCGYKSISESRNPL